MARRVLLPEGMTDSLSLLRSAAAALAADETERDPVPAVLEEMCSARVGKPVTKRDVADLEAAIPGLRVWLDKSHGVGFSYSVMVHVDRQTGVCSGSGWTGERDASGEAVRSPERAAQELALHALGVPSTSSFAIIYIRGWSDRSGGVTRWPTVEELRALNPYAYVGRETRNAARDAAAAAVTSPDALPLARIATLVDEINLLSAELRGLLVSPEVPDSDDSTPLVSGVPEEVLRAVAGVLTVSLDKGAR